MPTAAVLSDLRSCAAILADADVRLAVEFLPYAPLPTLADAIDVCEAVGWQRCGATTSTSRPNRWTSVPATTPTPGPACALSAPG
ncbi:sugar phosphate isomerase/epimerase [Phytohabitans rumicis]|uniref:sugar phosphate isomerase/epimerase n=1 Tax=Phytohabitans rumicis TaxID=1076125 RepID=UPI001C499EBE|nr:sugar phosphate isomerase/epimerase [Phytohabitans rumicis]